MSAFVIFYTIWSFAVILLQSASSHGNGLSGDLKIRREIFFLNLEDGYFGCQVNDSIDILKLFELSKLCDGTPQCFMGSDELHKDLKCTDDCTRKTGKVCQNGVCLGSQCHCNDGYGGKGCEMPDENECKLRPCDIFSHCTNTMGSYFCTCFPGYEGDGYKCSDIDECQIPELRSMCVKNSECCNLPGHFACKCIPGYTGDGRVECTDENECEDENICGENSVCQNIPGSYTCACKPGYTPTESNAGCRPICSSTTCPANAECEAIHGQPVCSCKNGFKGNPTDSEGCYSITDACRRDTDCSENEICAEHLAGRVCESVCNSVICEPSTVCVAKNHVAQCKSPCDQVQCGSHGHCRVEGLEAYCVCDDGWSYDPNNINAGCVALNVSSLHECNSVSGNQGSCGDHATCVKVNGALSCSCDSGFTGNPRHGCIDVNECLDSSLCGEGAECLNLIGKFDCICPSDTVADPNPRIRCTKVVKCGFDRDCPGNAFCDSSEHVCLCPEPNFGEQCRHPCEFHRCNENAECMIVNGQPSCVCSPGYTGAASSSAGCSDIDECLGNPCSDGQGCKNTPGSYLCKKELENITKAPCSPGFHRLNENGDCVPLCEGIVCGRNAQCVVIAEGSTCQCVDGFEGNPFPGGGCESSTCSPFNPCLPTQICDFGKCKNRCGSSSTCGLGAICDEQTNQCTCPNNHVGNPKYQCEPVSILPVCEPVCGVNAQCENGNRCVCNSGTTGDPYKVCGAQDRACLNINCGENAECWQDACRCKKDYPLGDPLEHCFKAPESLVDCSRGECKCSTSQNCPTGFSCVDASCKDLCVGVFCDSKSVCSYGQCKKRNCGPGQSTSPECESHDCESDKSCSSTEICLEDVTTMRRICIDGCSKMHCGPNTVCTTEQHRATCNCIPNYFGDASDRATGCQPFKIQNHECTSSVDCTKFNGGSCETDANGIRKCMDPCQNLLCPDPNHICQSKNGKAACRCADGFAVSKETSFCEKIRESNCRNDNDCDPSYGCVPDEFDVLRCSHVCKNFICATNAECHSAHGKPVCSCKAGFTGNPEQREGCHKSVVDKCQRDTDCNENQLCLDRSEGKECVSVCSTIRCGPQAICVPKNHAGQCQCPDGKYKGDPTDPISGCIPVPCVYNNDCNSSQTCNRLENKCTDVCDTNTCGENSICIAENHSYRCHCPVGFISLDPETGCLPLSTCNNNTCHHTAVCEPTLNGFECKCDVGYTGDPYSTGCRNSENVCSSNEDCAAHEVCDFGVCLTTCQNSCGANSVCKIVEHKAECVCKAGFSMKRTENGISCMREVSGCNSDQDCKDSICVGKECKSVCRSGEDCASGERCVYNMCMVPCIGKLQCPVGQTCAGGYCILGCRNNKECSNDQACIDHQCRDPCEVNGVCGPNSLCRVISHSPQCFCPEEFNSSPTTGCTRKSKKCSATQECPLGSVCLGGICSASCDKLVGCAAGEQCKNNICVRVCYTDSNCQPGEVCIEGVCSLGCRSDVDCVATETCISSQCRCGSGFISGSTGCRDINECDSSPCHHTAQCYNTPGSYKCVCPEGLVGEDVEKMGCYVSDQCNSNEDCANSLECVVIGNSESRCHDPCWKNDTSSEVCGLNALCSVVDHKKRCSCPEKHVGNPYSEGCLPADCATDTECAAEEKCSTESGKCINPCDEVVCENGICSPIAHRPTCLETCSKGYTLQNGTCTDLDECRNNPCHSTAICNNFDGGFTCSCPDGKLGEPEAHLSGCKTPGQCNVDSDCPTSAACKQGKCSDVCNGSCGKKAECTASNHTYACTCPARHKGDPLKECIEWACSEIYDCPSNETCFKNECINPCSVEQICGQNTDCTVVNHLSVCTCSPSYTGDPAFGCQSIKSCTSDAECPGIASCFGGVCVPRCSSTRDCLPGQKCWDGICHSACLRGSDCLKSQSCEEGVCKSIEGLCRSSADCSPDEFCSETDSGRKECKSVCSNFTVCGIHETCVANQHVGVCECQTGYIGTPPSCRPECEADSDCSSTQICFKKTCSDPCPAHGCGLNSHCSLVNSEKACVCNEGFVNDTRLGCLAIGCVEDSQCPENQKCDGAYCKVACELSNPCPENSTCLSKNHQPTCECQTGYEASFAENGSPSSLSCRPQCSTNSDCSSDQVCHENKCKSSCLPDACGVNANCHIVNHEVRCQCPNGFTGLATVECVRVAVPCRVTEDCLSSQFCSEDGICLSNCESNADCAVNERCNKGSCLLTCHLDNDCFLSHICLNNTCTIGCRSNDDCSGDESCQHQKCAKICLPDTCGLNSLCSVVNHTSHCMCPAGMIPNPTALVGCVREPVICLENSNCGQSFTCERRMCRKMCGSNTDCFKNELCDDGLCENVCRKDSECKDGEICSGITCIEGCRTDNECKSNETCLNKKCVNPCASEIACGTKALCSVENHQTKCSCIKPLVGDPHVGCVLPKLTCSQGIPCPEGMECLGNRCRLACSSNSQCFPDEQCFGGICKTLCSRDDQCGPGSICQGRICLSGCRTHSHCPNNQTCVNRICRDPCKGNVACGDCAICSVLDHRIQCQCPPGTYGMPSESCKMSQTPCSRGADYLCSSNERCEAGYCLQFCRVTSDCLCGQVCELGHCRNTCSNDQECGKEHLCHAGYCRAGCKLNSDCFENNACINGHCTDPCESKECGINAVCKASQHGGACVCSNGLPEGTSGCSNTTCSADSDCNKMQACSSAGICVNPCLRPGACGLNAQCKVVNREAVCLCPPGWTGFPGTECVNEELDCKLNPHRKECIAEAYSTCDNLICGRNAICKFKKNEARCVCPDSFPAGNPTIECHSSPDRSDDCRARECGRGASCQNINGSYVCQCPVGQFGNPDVSCSSGKTGKCRQNADCSTNLICTQNGCTDPCQVQNPCNGSQSCEVKNHAISCKPRVTSVSCTQNEQCPNDKYCSPDGSCRNPCSLTTCGQNAYCVPDKHASKCVCLEGTEYEGACIRRFRTDFPRPEMTVNCLADGVQVDILIGPFEAETRNTSEFNGLLYVKGHSKDPQCRKSVHPHLETVDFKVNFGTCGLLHNDGEAGFILVIQKHPRLVTYNAQAYDIKCIYMTGEKTITLGFNVSMLTTAGTIANTGPPPTCSMRIATAAGGEISSAEIGESLVLRVDVQPSSIYGGFVRNCVAKTMEGDGENEYPVTDENGCASDPTVFGDWEVEAETQILIAHFNAFKFPTSSSIKFQCNVRVCFGKCQPVNCGSQDAFGRKKRNTLREDVQSLLSIGFEGQLREEVRIESNPILAIERREDHLASPTEEPRISKEEVCISTNGFIVSLIITALLSLVAVAVAVSCWLMAYKRRNRNNPLPHPKEFPNPLFTVAELIAEPSPDYLS